MNVSEKRPAYKEPWFWMVFGPLVFVIIAGVGMVFVAFIGADDRVSDNYYKEGRMINNRFDAEHRAQALNITAQAQLTTSEIVLNLDGKQLPAQVQLEFSHPAEASKDKKAMLTRVGEHEYRGATPGKFTGRWYVILSAGQGESEWRITAEANFDESHTVNFIQGK